MARGAPHLLRETPSSQRQGLHLSLRLCGACGLGRKGLVMSNDTNYDIIIIGTGAGGGTLASKLAPSGKRILLLERGDYVPREKDNWSSAAVNLQGRYQT